MKQVVKLESFIEPVIEQLESRIDDAINVGSSDGVVRVARISLDQCMYFLLADAVGEIAVSKHFEPVYSNRILAHIDSVWPKFWPSPYWRP